MSRRPARWPGGRLLALAALLALGAGACGGSGGSGGSGTGGTGTGPSTPPPTTTTAATGSATGSARCPAGSGLRGSVNDHGAAAAPGPRLQLQAGDSFFTPTCQTGVRPGVVTLLVRNTGRMLHNLSIPTQGVDKDMPPGQTITVTVKLASTAVPFFCKYHRAAGMVGSLLPGQS